MMSLQKLVQWSSNEAMSVALGTPGPSVLVINAQFWLCIAVYSFLPLTHFSLDEDSSLQWRYCEHWYHEKVLWIMILWRSIVKPRLSCTSLSPWSFCNPQVDDRPQCPFTAPFVRWRYKNCQNLQNVTFSDPYCRQDSIADVFDCALKETNRICRQPI